ncbi:MAG: hypothetical protein IKI15_12355 [Lachnospiraceae bacterium]|nr:hypothetical protein [Lachnospiraceae bacterium]
MNDEVDQRRRQMFNVHDISRNEFMLHGPLARGGYDWRRHSFTAQAVNTGSTTAGGQEKNDLR